MDGESTSTWVCDELPGLFADVVTYCQFWVRREPTSIEIPSALRSPKLMAQAASTFPLAFDRQYGIISDEQETVRSDRFSGFVSYRKLLLYGVSLDPEVLGREKQRACSVLAIDYHAVSNDQMAEAETNFYIDAFDLPPWDTWLWLEGGILLAWVPHWMRTRVDSAIGAESHSAYSWVRIVDEDQIEVVGWGEAQGHRGLPLDLGY